MSFVAIRYRVPTPSKIEDYLPFDSYPRFSFCEILSLAPSTKWSELVGLTLPAIV